jgi:hypothetical protein
VVATRGVNGAKAGDVRSIALRPEAILLDGEGGDRNRMAGTIEEVAFLGSVVRIRVRFGDNAVSDNPPAAGAGSRRLSDDLRCSGTRRGSEAPEASMPRALRQAGRARYRAHPPG